MTGAYEGIIGFDPKNILERFRFQTPRGMETATPRREALRRHRRRGRGDREGPLDHADPGEARGLTGLGRVLLAFPAWPSTPSSSPSSPARPATRGRP